MSDKASAYVCSACAVRPRWKMPLQKNYESAVPVYSDFFFFKQMLLRLIWEC